MGSGREARKQGCPSGDAQAYIKAWGWSVPSRVYSRALDWWWWGGGRSK